MAVARRDSIKIDTIGGREYRLGSIDGIEIEPTQLNVCEQMSDLKLVDESLSVIDNLLGLPKSPANNPFFPTVLVSIMFLMWGYAYGLLDVLSV